MLLFFGFAALICIWHWARSHCAWLMRAYPLSWHTLNCSALGWLLLAAPWNKGDGRKLSVGKSHTPDQRLDSFLTSLHDGAGRCLVHRHVASVRLSICPDILHHTHANAEICHCVLKKMLSTDAEKSKTLIILIKQFPSALTCHFPQHQVRVKNKWKKNPLPLNIEFS